MNIYVQDSTRNKAEFLQARKEWSMLKYLEEPYGHHMVSPQLAKSRAVDFSYTLLLRLRYLNDLQLPVIDYICLCVFPPRSCNDQQNSYFHDNRQVRSVICYSLENAVN